jgi:hypothetical protein
VRQAAWRAESSPTDEGGPHAGRDAPGRQRHRPEGRQYVPAPTGIGYAYAGDTPGVMFTPVRDVPSCVS